MWPDDGRVRAPGADSKPGIASKPYVLNLCVHPEVRRKGLARALMAVSERFARDIWGDPEILLHVEKDKDPANALYEALGYNAQKYTYDAECPYTKAEAKVLKTVYWRRKTLPLPSLNSPAATGCKLPEQEQEQPKDFVEAEKERIRAMRVKELKDYLDSFRTGYADCFEKSELVARALTVAEANPGGPPSEDDEEEEEDEEDDDDDQATRKANPSTSNDDFSWLDSLTK